MLESLVYLLLDVGYIAACRQERREEELRAKKMKVFSYAVRNSLSYEYVVDQIKSGKLTFSKIDECLRRPIDD